MTVTPHGMYLQLRFCNLPLLQPYVIPVISIIDNMASVEVAKSQQKKKSLQNQSCLAFKIDAVTIPLTLTRTLTH